MALGYISQLPPSCWPRLFLYLWKCLVSSPAPSVCSHQKFLCTGVSSNIQQKLTVHCETPRSTVTQFWLAWWTTPDSPYCNTLTCRLLLLRWLLARRQHNEPLPPVWAAGTRCCSDSDNMSCKCKAITSVDCACFSGRLITNAVVSSNSRLSLGDASGRRERRNWN